MALQSPAIPYPSPFRHIDLNPFADRCADSDLASKQQGGDWYRDFLNQPPFFPAAALLSIESQRDEKVPGLTLRMLVTHLLQSEKLSVAGVRRYLHCERTALGLNPGAVAGSAVLRGSETRTLALVAVLQPAMIEPNLSST